MKKNETIEYHLFRVYLLTKQRLKMDNRKKQVAILREAIALAEKWHSDEQNSPDEHLVAIDAAHSLMNSFKSLLVQVESDADAPVPTVDNAAAEASSEAGSNGNVSGYYF